MSKPNVSRQNPLKWEDYVGKAPRDAILKIYDDACAVSVAMRGWYWRSIGTKRRASTFARWVSFLLGAVGVLGPLAAAWASTAECKLVLAQSGVAALALAGVVLLGDKVFGWSSGWLRYVSTVTAMERQTLQFELDWTAACLGRAAGFTEDDKKTFFELARQYQIELEKRRGEETEGWVAEFNTGTAALNDMIKFQKDATEKAARDARAAVETAANASLTGAIELTIAQPAGSQKPVSVRVDDDVAEPDFLGSSWAKLGVSPGKHRLHVSIAGVGEASRIADVAPGAVARVEVKIP